MLGKMESRRRRGRQRMIWLDGITNSMNKDWVDWQLVMDREAWHAMVHGDKKSRTRLSNWTELNWTDGSNIRKMKAKEVSWNLRQVQCQKPGSHRRWKPRKYLKSPGLEYYKGQLVSPPEILTLPTTDRAYFTPQPLITTLLKTFFGFLLLLG